MSVLERERATTTAELEVAARRIRRRSVEAIAAAGVGHFGSTLSCADLLAVLYHHSLRLDPEQPEWPERDRFVLGKGHVAVGAYVCLAELGFFPDQWLDRFCDIDGPLDDHPDMNLVPGWDFSSGSIGHGLSVGVGFALAGRLQRRSHRTFVLMGDGELNEGQSWEAAMSAAHYRLGNLVAIIDRNELSLDGRVQDVMSVEPIQDKFAAFGWDTVRVDGHDLHAIRAALDAVPAVDEQTPTVIVADTIKGRGVPFMEGDADWHMGGLGPEDRDRVLTALSDPDQTDYRRGQR